MEKLHVLWPALLLLCLAGCAAENPPPAAEPNTTVEMDGYTVHFALPEGLTLTEETENGYVFDPVSYASHGKYVPDIAVASGAVTVFSTNSVVQRWEGEMPSYVMEHAIHSWVDEQIGPIDGTSAYLAKCKFDLWSPSDLGRFG